MNEGAKSEKVKRLERIQRMARNPLFYLENGKNEKGYSCAHCIRFLRDLKKQIAQAVKEKPTLSAEGVDGRFLQFYRTSDSSPDQFVALFELLRETGFTRTDVESALMDNMPSGQHILGGFLSKQNAVPRYLDITRQALDVVYKKEA